MFISSAYAQTAPAAAGGGDLMTTVANIAPIILMFIVLWFMMIRPQMKKAKEHQAMVSALAKGDEVVVGGGMLGKITKLGEQYVSVEIANGVEVQVQRPSIVTVLPKGSIK